MKQAGDGADYMEGWEGAGKGGGVGGRGACFKCGQRGHWAANCPQAIAEKEASPVSIHALTQINEKFRTEAL